MPVSLKIVSFKGLPYGTDEPVIIDREGGSIGRLDSCALVLPDKEKIVSRQHATISYENDAFVLADISLGGTYIDESPTALNKSSITLVDGMLLRMGEYQIQVKLLPESSNNLSAFADKDVNRTPFIDPNTSPFDTDNALLNSLENTDQVSSLVSENTLATEQVNPLLSNQQDSFIPATEHHETFSALHDSFIPPSPTGERHANDEMPDDFNFEELFSLNSTTADTQSVTPPFSPNAKPTLHENGPLEGSSSKPFDEPLSAMESLETGTGNLTLVTAESEPKQPGHYAGNLYRSFLQGAALHLDDITISEQEDRMRHIGSMFRQFVESTVAVLRSRAEFKSLFRVTVTTIKKADNNPLKFSVTTDEALQHLLKDKQGGFKKSVDAIDEGFQDILNHQMAMQAGIQASLQEILSQFEPNRIEKKFEDGLVLNKKAKCWDRYSEVYARLTEKVVDDFYGDAFSEAYEQQMRQISALNQKENLR